MAEGSYHVLMDSCIRVMKSGEAEDRARYAPSRCKAESTVDFIMEHGWFSNVHRLAAVRLLFS